ncbi:MAG TPA: hypothetical protein VJU61_20650, partial [Polyangiaceae bacterium]|nr:hypothetical protein [Polyangiaceae bacterium]
MSHSCFATVPSCRRPSEWGRLLRPSNASWLALALSLAACSGNSGSLEQPVDPLPADDQLPPNVVAEPFRGEPSFFKANTVSQRVGLPLAPPGA